MKQTVFLYISFVLSVCIFVFSCKKNSMSMPENESVIITIPNGSHGDKTYVKTYRDTLSNNCFEVKKYSNGYYCIEINNTKTALYDNKNIVSLRNKVFIHKSGDISSNTLSDLSSFLKTFKKEFCIDSICGLVLWSPDIFDIDVEISFKLENRRIINNEDIESAISKTNLKMKINKILSEYNLKASSIILNYNGKYMTQDTKKFHIDGEDYNYQGIIPDELLIVPLRVIVKKTTEKTL